MANYFSCNFNIQKTDVAFPFLFFLRRSRHILELLELLFFLLWEEGTVSEHSTVVYLLSIQYFGFINSLFGWILNSTNFLLLDFGSMNYLWGGIHHSGLSCHLSPDL